MLEKRVIVTFKLLYLNSDKRSKQPNKKFLFVSKPSFNIVHWTIYHVQFGIKNSTLLFQNAVNSGPSYKFFVDGQKIVIKSFLSRLYVNIFFSSVIVKSWKLNIYVTYFSLCFKLKVFYALSSQLNKFKCFCTFCNKTAVAFPLFSRLLCIMLSNYE